MAQSSETAAADVSLAPLREEAPKPLAALRAEIARIAARDGFFSRDFNDLDGEAAAPQKLHPYVPLGHDCRFDRLLGGGLQPGTLTEILAARPGDAAAAAGFLSGLAIRLAARVDKAKAALFWIFEDFAASEQGLPYGPGLALHGLDPGRLVLVAAPNATQMLWAMEEALKCPAPAVVIGELWSGKPYDLTASRRLLLAAQKHGTPALLFLAGVPGAAGSLSSGADLRFEVRAHPSVHPPSAGALALPGAARWSVRIAKARIKARMRARAGPDTISIDRERFHTLIFDHDEALFRDALPLALAPDTRDGSAQPALAQG
jgi:protein ImuA